MSSTHLGDADSCRVPYDGAVLLFISRVLDHQIVPDPRVLLAGLPLSEHRDGGPDVPPVIAVLYVLTQSLKHLVCIVNVSLVVMYLGISANSCLVSTLSNTVSFFQTTLAGQRGAFLQAILAPQTSSSSVRL